MNNNENKKWQILTWFKNKTPTFYTFQNFYKKYWNVTHFIYVIGYTSNEDKDYLMNNYFGNATIDKTQQIRVNNQYIFNVVI